MSGHYSQKKSSGRSLPNATTHLLLDPTSSLGVISSVSSIMKYVLVTS